MGNLVFNFWKKDSGGSRKEIAQLKIRIPWIEMGNLQPFS